MARFVRDEKRTYPFTWLLIGGLFAGSAVGATYAELTTRVPWQGPQEKFYDLELELSRKALEQQQAAWERLQQQSPLKEQLAQLAALKAQQTGGDYAAAAAKLKELDGKFLKAEMGKTFGGSDLDEAYYYRNLAEYKRDAAQVAVRDAYKAAYPDNPQKAVELANAIYADPPPPEHQEGETDAIYHLRTEVSRNQAHRENAEAARAQGGDEGLLAALKASYQAESGVISQLEKELKHQRRVDRAEVEMANIDGPQDPRVSAEDASKMAAARHAARVKACTGHEDTRNCLKWLKLEPVDQQVKKLELAISKAKRPLADAQLRYDKALRRAEPKFDPGNLIGSLVGPLEIKQVVTSWMEYKRDVDIEQVDRCQTCHMGVDRALYTAADIDPLYRTHPRRSELMAAHPIEKFGCTVCHQGQGRATNDMAHSSIRLEEHHGKERWHMVGDHHWEDPMLQVGHLSKIVIGANNDEFEVKIGKGKKTKIALEQGQLKDTSALLEQLQTKLQAVVKASKGADKWRAVVRRIDNRIQLGIVTDDSDAAAAKKKPAVSLFFPEVGTAELLGFGRTREIKSKTAQLHIAPLPMVQPVVAENSEAQGVFSRTAFAAPRGAHGLQIPDEMRNRFVQGLPETESGCLRCHQQDTDLVPRSSGAAYVAAKLKREQAEAELAQDSAAYIAEHGSAALPSVPNEPSKVNSLAPTLDQGKALFQQLNCTGCHLLEGYANNPDQGPALDHVAAKVTPKWLLTWLRDPRGWRAKTSMPNLWPRPLDPASKLPYPEGSPEYAKWEKEMREETVAIAAFLFERGENPADGKPLSEKIAGYANVPGADAAAGKKVFEAYGCQGCHADTDDAGKLPKAWRDRERDIAPTLSNLANKTRADWIAYWVEDPSRYWHGTSMPNLRLSRKEAASVALYLASKKSDAPRAAKVADEDVKLVTSAEARKAMVACRVAGGEMMSRAACGKRVVEFRGCYGCHDVSGFGSLAPIGPELSGFATKDISTLDFGYAIADHHLQTTETFATLKLDSPRIYTRDRIELKMGDFDLSAGEIRALVVFLKGTVPARPNAAFDPMKKPAYAAVVRGRKLVNDLNCRGCHVLEGRGADIDGFRADALSADAQARAPYLNGEGGRVQPEWLFSFLRDPQAHGVRPWLHPEWAFGDEVPADKLALRMPSFNLSVEQWTDVVRYFASWDKAAYPFQVPAVAERSKQEKLWALANMNSTQTGNCLSCHYYDEFPLARGRSELKKMAPNLAMVRKRLRPKWVEQWLLRPQNYLHYTKMTAFFASVDRPADALYWPKENDPYLSPSAMGWDAVLPELGKLPAPQQAAIVRDMLFSFPEGAPWPAKGAEATSVMVDPDAAASSTAAAEDAAAAAAVGVHGALVPSRRRF